MKHNSSILLALSFLVGVLIIGMSLNVYAQTSDFIPLEDRKHYAQFSLDNIRVEEKEFYKVIFIDVNVKVKDLALEDGTGIMGKVTLTNENGKSYQPNAPCPKSDFYCTTTIMGTDGGIRKFTFTYMVEKEFNNFKVSYNYYDLRMQLYTYPIGNIDLTQNTNGQDQTPSSSPTDSNPSSSIPSIASASQSATNIFEQLMNFLKQIFHFMVLGSTFLNDS